MNSYLRHIILGISCALPLLAINEYHFNFLGIGICGVILGLFVLLSKKITTKFEYILGTVAFLMAINFALKSDPMVLFYSFLVYIYAISWTIVSIPKDKVNQILYFFCPFMLVLVQTLATKDILPRIFSKTITNKETEEKTENQEPVVVKKDSKAGFYWINAIVTILVLCIIIPLLSYSNPYFGQVVDQIMTSLYNTFRDIFSFASIVRIIIGLILYSLLPKLFCYLNTQKPQETQPDTEFDLSIPKIAVIATIFAFFVAQIQTYFNSNLLVNNTGKTVNEIFFHLSVVCLVVFALLCISLKAKILAKVSSWILLFQGLVLGTIALNSDWTYIANWGFTHKRLYGLALIIWVFGAIFIFGQKILKNINLVKSLVLLVAIVFGTVNLINLEFLIYQNPPREATGIEKSYISTMSLDSGSLEIEYKKQLSLVQIAQKEGGFNFRCSEATWFRINTSQIRYLQKKYSKTQILSWNYTEHHNYQKIKDIKLIDAFDISYQGEDYSNGGYQNCYKRVFSSWQD